MARIVIVGAGMSGLAAAARLGTLGHRVTVCEAGPTYGGELGRHEADGFRFDTGPTLLALPAVYRDLALKSGREPLEELVRLAPVDPESRHLFPDGTELVLPNASRGRVAEALDAAFGPGTGERWGEVSNRARTVWEATRRPLLEEPLPADPTPLHTDPYPAPPRRGLARLRRERPHTLAAVAAEELGGGAGPTALLYEYALRHGLDPRTAPAGATVLAYMEQSFGVWSVGGGLRELATAVYRRCEQRRVEFRFGTPVTEVLSADGRVAGVLTDGPAGAEQRIDADVVLVAAGGGLLPPAARPVPRRLSVLLSLRGERPAGTAVRTVVHARDGAAELAALFDRGEYPRFPTVQVHRPGEGAPAGHEAVTLTVTVPPGGPDLPDGYPGHLLEHLAGAGLDLRDRLLRLHVPERSELRPPSLAGLGGAFLSPPNATDHPQLYRIGSAAHPGGGLARTGMSACVVAGLIGPA
ncbi:phytoene desaturase family protein [Kitasatospora sp. NPDC096147]|uniref:phytoene desaturase family protein n=1 Tax=Kitasatospora sp. NPDC096147 TaxID=3364093 RepID=UPI00380AE49F